jgi:hypothetical protein
LRKFEVLQVVVLGYALIAKYPYETITPHSHLGYVSAAKRNPTKEDLYFISIAGPIFSLFACLLGSTVLLYSAWDAPVENIGVALVAAVLSLSSGHSFYDSIVVRQGYENDRAQVDRLKENPQREIELYDQLARYVDFSRRRPRDCSDEEWKSIPMILKESREINLYCFWSRFDEDDLSLAEQHIRTALAEASSKEDKSGSDALIFDEMAMFAARYLEDKVLADHALSLLAEHPEGEIVEPYGETTKEYVWGDREKSLEVSLAQLKLMVARRTQGKDRIYVVESYERIFPELKGKVSPK